MRIITSPQDEFTLSFEEALDLNPGTFVMAQDGSICLIVTHTREFHRIVLLSRCPALIDEGQGYARFKILPYNVVKLIYDNDDNE